MKKSVLLVTLLLIFTLTTFCACGNNDNKNIDENGTLSDDAKDIIDDGDLDMNDNATNSGDTNNNGTTNNDTTGNGTTGNGTTNNTTGNTTDDSTK